ncbi:MAG TPA: FAD-dependent oxidoreductase, partial [Candidatus Limnocylindria bacterium]|nr:FAD-dependent oxidoreductase [Candidatus Limnocylindria bacterium]
AGPGAGGVRMKRVLLVGAGHAHAALARRAVPQLVAAGAEVTLVAPGPFWYSGLATGMLGGGYASALDMIDVGAVVVRGGGRFVRGMVTALVPAERAVALSTGETLSYDLLSLDVGSVVRGDALPGALEYGVLAKPIERLAEVRSRLEAGFARRDALRVCVVGDGATGVELAAAVLSLARRCRGSVTVMLVGKEPRLAPGFPEAARDWLAAHLRSRGAELRLGVEAVAVVAAGVRLAGGEEIAADVTLVATGLRPPAVLAEAGLPCDAEGAMIVDRSLRCPVYPEIFGAGDCIAFAARALPRVGVYAVRQAPVLAHNLLAALRGAPLSDYEPQRAYLLVLNLGDGTGLAVRGQRWWYGRAAFRLKDWIDRRWLAAQR